MARAGGAHERRRGRAVTRSSGAPRSAATTIAVKQLSGGYQSAETPCGSGPVRRARRLRDHAHAIRWGGYQRALSRGDRERAEVLERRARALEDRADVLDAKAWRPVVKLARLSPDDRIKLGNVLDAQRVEAERAARLQRHRAIGPPAGDRRRARYVEAVLAGECARVADTAPGSRNNTLASASFKCGQVVCDTDDGFERLLEAALAAGLSEREARPVIRSGLRAGCRKPRRAA